MAEHTEGPWCVGGQSTRGLVIQGALDKDDLRPIVGFAVGPYHGQIDARTEADARLIASAPDLLAACEEIVRAWQPGWSLDCPQGVAMARAAVEKAKGTS